MTKIHNNTYRNAINTRIVLMVVLAQVDTTSSSTTLQVHHFDYTQNLNAHGYKTWMKWEYVWESANRMIQTMFGKEDTDRRSPSLIGYENGTKKDRSRPYDNILSHARWTNYIFLLFGVPDIL